MEKKLNNKGIKKNLKDPKFRIIFVCVIIFAFLLFVNWFMGIFKTPAHFRTVKFASEHQVSQYLTNVILPEFYNKSQLGTPFEIELGQEGVNDIVVRHLDWERLKQAGFSDIGITFKKGRILLSAKTKYRKQDFVITAILRPKADKNGFNAGLTEIQAGTSIIPFAKDFLREKVLYEIIKSSADANFVSYAGLILSDNKMNPEFSFQHRNFKITKIHLEDKKIILRFQPE
ncbi:MAG: hypothetical protein BWY69_00441 [Planctomycetes bacterium ADurb.Bin401]|nr:MAG: hypothetical protein BWY69_00441 [Planctomycetes bacterium ADurb.Bin401]